MLKKILVLTLLALAATTANASFIDKRSADGVVEVAYRNIPVSTLVGELKPAEFQSEVANEFANQRVSVAGKGTWLELINKALEPSKLAAVLDGPARKIVVIRMANSTSASLGSTAKPPVAQAAAVDLAMTQGTYQLLYSDGNIRNALQRWLDSVKMQLVYEAPRDFPIPAEAKYTGKISDVLQQLMKSLKNSDYPLRACRYENRAVLILHRDLPCPMEEE